MGFQKTIREISDKKFFIAIQPPLTKEEMEALQMGVLEYFKLINEFALAGKMGQRGGISYFVISTPYPWPGFKKAVELGLKKGLKELNKI